MRFKLKIFLHPQNSISRELVQLVYLVSFNCTSFQRKVQAGISWVVLNDHVYHKRKERRNGSLYKLLCVIQFCCCAEWPCLPQEKGEEKRELASISFLLLETLTDFPASAGQWSSNVKKCNVALNCGCDMLGRHYRKLPVFWRRTFGHISDSMKSLGSTNRTRHTPCVMFVIQTLVIQRIWGTTLAVFTSS